MKRQSKNIAQSTVNAGMMFRQQAANHHHQVYAHETSTTNMNTCNKRTTASESTRTLPKSFSTNQPPKLAVNSKQNNQMLASKETKLEKKTAPVNGSQNTLMTARNGRMKKAFVRFDDYLDLNEENMRRSCKRLMNHLYSETTSGSSQVSTSASSSVLAPSAISDQAPGKCPATPTATLSAGAANNNNNGKSVNGGANRGKCISIDNDKKSLAQPSPLPPVANPAITTTTTASANTNGKSYLRSQYERRQQRQLELMSKMQLEPEGKGIAGGANGCQMQNQSQVKQQQHKNLHQQQQKHEALLIQKKQEEQRRRQMQQQDLVARSHELSKRRFFEKLERRESIKNSNLKGTLNEQSISATHEAATLDTAAETAVIFPQEKVWQISRPTTDTVDIQNGAKQKSPSRDNELMLKVYQSIALKGESASTDNTSGCRSDDHVGGGETSESTAPKMDTLGRSDGAVNCGTKELAIELIELCTPSPLPSADSQATNAMAEQLIEFSVKEQQEQQACEKFSSLLKVQQQQVRKEQQLSTVALAITPNEDESAFEINVPPNGSGILSHSELLKQTDGFINSGLLVKQIVAGSESQSVINSTPVSSCSASANTVTVEFDEPPILSGRQESKASTQQIVNKMEAPLDDSTDIKVKQIDVRGATTTAGTMASSIKVATTDSSESPDESAQVKSKSHLPSTVDNNLLEQSAVLISPTISGGNNHGSNDSIGAVDRADRATNKDQDGTKNSSDGSVIKKFEIDPASEQGAAIEVGGESDHAKDHEAPETKMKFVEQPGGGNAGPASTVVSLCEIPTLVGSDFSSHPNQTEKAAQQPQLATNWRTITKQTISDVLPEASYKMNQREAIVNIVAPECDHDMVDMATANIGVRQQVNDLQKKRGMEQQHCFVEGSCSMQEGVYANSKSPGARDNEAGRILNIEMIEEDNKLIESRYTAGHHANLVAQKQLRRENSAEEDGGSSCSSSGFGASISDGANSIGDTVISMADNKQHKVDCEYRRPTPLVIMSLRGNNDGQDHDCNPIYDSICQPRSRSSNQPLPGTNELTANQKLVGPDQAYPKGRPLIVENYNYAFALNGCHLSQPGSSIVPECDGLADEGYANLPLRNKALPIEYAATRSLATEDENHSNSKCKEPYNEILYDANSSGCSYSTDSRNSGGFSKLPPAKHSSLSHADNPESSDSIVVGSSAKKSSLLRKFGSMVSRAFTSSSAVNPGQQLVSSPSKISEQDHVLDLPEALVKTDDHESRTALVIERIPVDSPASESCHAQIGEADLVIVQTKHVNQRRRILMPLSVKQHEGQNSALYRRHDDRIARGKRYSHKLRRSSSASDVDSESSVSCSSYSSLDMRLHRPARSRKSESLLEELESLVGSSKDSRYRISGGQKQTRSLSQCIDIDCVSPASVDPQVENILSQSAWTHAPNKSAGGPRSLLRLLNPISSQKVVESTPNLIDPTQSKRSTSQCGLTSDKDNSIQPNSGFWGFSSLIGPSHAIQRDAPKSKNRDRKHHHKGSRPDTQCSLGYEDHGSLIYSNLHSLNTGYKLQQKQMKKGEQHSLDKYQSVSLYQNLLQSYAKRRQHSHHGRHHHHHHHHHHHRRAHHTISYSRQTHRLPTRCVQDCGQSCQGSSSGSENACSRAVVCGQLIKINKSDGSQVVELQRSPGKSWGFFVARGAINNVKGIFISRMHDNATSSSLSGLLTIGDRILAIDECPIGPDYDILRVNQMISKKSKILLKVKPFKG